MKNGWFCLIFAALLVLVSGCGLASVLNTQSLQISEADNEVVTQKTITDLRAEYITNPSPVFGVELLWFVDFLWWGESELYRVSFMVELADPADVSSINKSFYAYGGDASPKISFSNSRIDVMLICPAACGKELLTDIFEKRPAAPLSAQAQENWEELKSRL